MHITASKLYDYIQCPHRVWRDVYGPKDEKIKETNPFVQLLWDRGVVYEEKVISKIGEFLDLSISSTDDAFKKTIEAMNDRVPLIYQPALIKDNLSGRPDLLKLMPDGQYIPIDIKSGMGRSGADDETGEEGKLKKHYAVQLALYSDLLNQFGFQHDRAGIILDIHGDEVYYDLNQPVTKTDKTTFWELYEQVKQAVNILLNNQAQNKPAMAGVCKVCPWYNSCKKWVAESDDLTGLFYLGRSKRDTLNEDTQITTIQDILGVDIADMMAEKAKDKTFLKRIGQTTLEKIVQRANVLKNIKKPVVYEKIDFPDVSYELFFDIEDDPTREFVYLHGVYERGPDGERFLDFTAKEATLEAEKKAWADFWQYINSLPPDDYAVYYYSAHEKSTYRRMQKLHPDVISENDVEKFFANPNVIDLYAVVLKNTDWPLGSYSIKALAVYLGFEWRDKTPSGALSIEWFNQYIATKDETILDRILIYNEDDCRATMVLKDGLKEMSDQL